jgi:branched-chain amino acid aminotransferase
MAQNDQAKGNTAGARSTSWTLYLNGEFVPFDEARVSISDLGFIKGEAIFDCGRTAKHKPFRLEEHIERLYRNLKFAKLDPGLSPEQMKRLCLDVLEKNLHLMRENDDCWIFRPDSPFVRSGYRSGSTHNLVSISLAQKRPISG